MDLDRKLIEYYGIKLRLYVGMPDEIFRSLMCCGIYQNNFPVTCKMFSKMFSEIIAYQDKSHTVVS